MKKTFLMVLGVIFVLSVITINITYLSIDVGNSEYLDVDNENLKISKVSGKIHINNNWSDAKTAGVCIGEGTESDPYIIEDLVIDGGDSGNCILIENTEEHFKIENCSVSNWGNKTYDAGIKLLSVRNGNLTNNLATNPVAYGIILEESINNIIVRNIIRGRNGIRFFCSNSNVVYLNEVDTNHFDLEYRNSINNRFHTPKKMEYIFNNNRYTSYLGNYWDDYTELDNNNDGIGDTPYILDLHLPSGQWVYVDYYPLTNYIENYEIIGEVSSEDRIPGYNLFFLIGLISIISISLLKRLKHSIK